VGSVTFIVSTGQVSSPGRRAALRTRQPLEAELSQALRRVGSARNRQLVARYLGWDGQAPCTLADAAVQYRVTRERARQLFEAALPSLRQHRVPPTLPEVLAYIRKQHHELVPEVERGLKRQGLTRGGISVQGVLRAARVFRCKPGFQLHRVGDAVFVGPVSQVAQTILIAAKKAVVRNGAFRVRDLCLHVSAKRRGQNVDERLVRRVLDTRADIGWLDAAHEWFWLSSVHRNRLVARVRKVLAVHPRVSLKKLHAAVSRDNAPLDVPEPILRSFCAQLPWCCVAGQHVEASIAPSVEDVLKGGEAILIAILQGHGGVLPLPALRNLCKGRVKKHNLWRILSFSPLIERLGRETYGLLET